MCIVILELPLVKRVNFNSQGVKPLVLCVQHLFINIEVSLSNPILVSCECDFSSPVKRCVCVNLEVVPL